MREQVLTHIEKLLVNPGRIQCRVDGVHDFLAPLRVWRNSTYKDLFGESLVLFFSRAVAFVHGFALGRFKRASAACISPTGAVEAE